MNELLKLINDSKRGNTNSILTLIEKFNPLIIKYSMKLSYDGSYSDLLISLLQIIHDIPIYRRNRIEDDGFVVGYINASIKHKYICLAKKNSNILKIEVTKDMDFIDENFNKFEAIENILFLENLIGKLPSSQKKIIQEIYINNRSEIDLSRMLHVSKQAINRSKNKAIKRMRTYLLNSERQLM